MPLLVPCEELQPGMRLAEAFFWHGRMMFSADTPLAANDIRSFQARFPKHNFRVIDPVLDAGIEFEDDSYERGVARVAQGRIADCLSEVSTRFSTHASLSSVCVSTIQVAVLEVVKYLEDHPVSAALVDSFIGGEGYLREHAGNVFYLSMLLGTSAHNYVAKERTRQSTSRELEPGMVKNLVPLGLGATLMDLGMLPLETLYTQKTPLTPDAWADIREHPIAGADSLPEEFSAAARTVVRTHHENMDGSGYPDGLPAERLHVFSRIVRIADAYDAATSTRVYDEAKSPVRVLWEMSVGPYKRFYDQELMNMFVRLMQPFPIGSKIRLRNGQYAVVVKYNRQNPIAPVVVVAFDSRNRRLANNELSVPVSLGEQPELCAASFGGEDLSFLYDATPTEATRSRVGVWPSLFEAAYP
jgi:hypothetical protein